MLQVGEERHELIGQWWPGSIPDTLIRDTQSKNTDIQKIGKSVLPERVTFGSPETNEFSANSGVRVGADWFGVTPSTAPAQTEIRYQTPTIARELQELFENKKKELYDSDRDLENLRTRAV
jgi:hypothetical protein